MFKKVSIILVLVICLVIGFSGLIFADNYPDKSIKWIVVWRAGGGADTATRIYLKYLEPILGQKCNVVNIVGGATSVGFTEAKNAKPDGYTLVCAQGDLPKFKSQMTAPIRVSDFDIIGSFAYQSPIFVCRSEAPWNNVSDFVKDAKANPGELTIGISNIGGTYHQPMLLWQEMAGFEATAIVLESSPKQAAALLGGHVDAIITWVRPCIPYIEEGQFKFLGYMGSERHDNFPDVPTFTELGYDIVWEHPYGAAGPKGLPEEVKVILSEANEKVWEVPEFKEELSKLGLLIYKKDGKEYKKHLEKMEDDMVAANKLIK